MRIGIPKEVQAGETRVALIPSLIPLLIKDQHEVLVEAGAGVGACFSDTQYLQTGASLIKGAPALYEQVDMILKVQPPQMHPATHLPEAGMVREGSAYYYSCRYGKIRREKEKEARITHHSRATVARERARVSRDALGESVRSTG
jgi:hypothetical protein